MFSMRSVAMKSSVFSSRRARAASPMLMAPAICPFRIGIGSSYVPNNGIARDSLGDILAINDDGRRGCGGLRPQERKRNGYETFHDTPSGSPAPVDRTAALPAPSMPAMEDSTPRWDKETAALQDFSPRTGIVRVIWAGRALKRTTANCSRMAKIDPDGEGFWNLYFASVGDHKRMFYAPRLKIIQQHRRTKPTKPMHAKCEVVHLCATIGGIEFCSRPLRVTLA